MQSYGTQDRYSVRTTDREPSLSAVVGLIVGALGRPVTDPIDDLAGLKMGVRTDRPPEIIMDYHTVEGGKAGTREKGDQAITHRYYLADAIFLVGLEGRADDLVRISNALERPSETLFLGRMCCTPSMPLTLPDGLRNSDLETTLREYPWVTKRVVTGPVPARLKLQLPADIETATAMRMDYPLSLVPGRSAYAPRYVRDTWTARPESS